MATENQPVDAVGGYVIWLTQAVRQWGFITGPQA